ncbi:MAG TPA: MarR family transcriptional regulator, partial [Actinomycetota bacterium]
MTKSRTVEEMAAPLGSIKSGRLVFTRGASHLELRVDAQMEDLYRARFEGKVPEIRLTEGTVSVRYRPSIHPPRGEITLSGRIPWALEARWGMSDVTADLQELELTSLEISGGASKVEVRMPHPKVAVPIRIGGGASDITVIRP